MLPPGIATALVHMDAPLSFIGDPGRLHVTIKPSEAIVWAATGTPLGNFIDNLRMDPGVPLEVELPRTEQDGFLDAAGNSFKNWHYIVQISYEKDGQVVRLPERAFQILGGQADLDLALVPAGPASVETSAPVPLVLSVNGMTGNITIGKADVGLANIDNTSDINKPISAAVQAALDQKANIGDSGIGNGDGAVINADGELENMTPGGGIVLRSPDGTRIRITVANDGAVTTTALPATP